MPWPKIEIVGGKKFIPWHKIETERFNFNYLNDFEITAIVASCFSTRIGRLGLDPPPTLAVLDSPTSV